MNTIAPGYSQFVRNGIEFVMDSGNGEVFLTAGGYCNLSGIDIAIILDRLDNMEEGIDWHDSKIYTIKGKKSARLIPTETIFDWLLVDNVDVAAKIARETCAASVYFYRLAGSTINQGDWAKSIIEVLEQQKKDIELLKEQVKESAENVKAQEIENLRIQEAANRQAERATIKLTTNKESDRDFDDKLEDYLTVFEYLEDVGGKARLNDAIQLNDAAIILCQNKNIEIREIIRNKLGTVYAFPISVLKQLDKKRKTVPDDDPEPYFTIPQYFNLVPNRQKKINLSDAITLNALAFNICKEKGIDIKQETFTTLGTINAFPVSVIEQIEKYLNQ